MSGNCHQDIFISSRNWYNYDAMTLLLLSTYCYYYYYPLTVPQICVLSRSLKFTPIPHSDNRLSHRERIVTFERSLQQAEFIHETNNSDDNRHNKYHPKSSWSPSFNRDKFLHSYILKYTSEIMNALNIKDMEICLLKNARS